MLSLAELAPESESTLTETRSVYLSEYVLGRPLDASHLEVRAEPLAALAVGEVLLETLYLSADPYMRGCMTGLGNYYLSQFELDQPLYSVGVARVLESRDREYLEGDLVTGSINWSERSIWSSAAYGARHPGGPLRAVPKEIHKVSHVLGALGTNGVTAFFGVLSVAKPRRGETLVVSSAAGGVGSIAGQIAKIMGATVIGLTSSTAKRHALVHEMGFDAALDYRSPTIQADILALLPNGPDIYFDNVGGMLSQAIMNTMTRPARIIECGQISTYDDDDGGWSLDIRPIHGRGLRFEGYTPALFKEFEPAALAQLSHWMESGKLLAREHEHFGLESAPAALLGLFGGDNIGKQIVAVNPER